MKINKKINILTGFVLSAAIGICLIFNPFNKNETSIKRMVNTFNFSIDPQINKISSGSTFAQELIKKGFSSLDVHYLVKNAIKVFNFNQIKSGTVFQVFETLYPVRAPIGVRVKFSEAYFLDVLKESSTEFSVTEKKEPITTKLITYSGVVEDSLWGSALATEMDPEIIVQLTEIFAWQVDFSREVRKGDRWRLVVEENQIDGKHFSWGNVLVAEYLNSKDVITGVYFEKNNIRGYFALDGSSLKKMFLRSPIQYGRISSRFQRKRFHPILKRSRPHLGVDYAAARGTPVRAVGDGVVTFVGNKGDAGKAVIVRHNSTYQTAYKHLNGFPSGIRSGVRVYQGQTIGYVGSTGLATGPHLHFEFYQNGVFVDPLGKKFPSADPVPSSLFVDYEAFSKLQILKLPPWYYPGVSIIGPVELAFNDNHWINVQ